MLPEDPRAAKRDPLRTRGRTVAAASSLAFLATAAALTALLPAHRTLHPAVFVVLVAAYAGSTHVRFHAGTGETTPVQIVFVTMLFVLPLPLVPVAVAVGELAATAPGMLSGRVRLDRLLPLPANAWFSIGPVVVLAAAGLHSADLDRWPVLVAALGAQFACDLVASSVLAHFGQGGSPRPHGPVLGWVWLVDALLTPLGLVAALASVHHEFGFVLVFTLPGLLALFARERNERIDQTLELFGAYRGTALLLSELLERADAYTGGDHTRGVVELSLLVSDELGLSAAARRRVELAALLHDVGKIAIPTSIITKPGPLTGEEWAIMRTHTIEGQRMLDRVGGALAEVGQIVRASHERHDGRGYPDGLAGKRIPREAAIISACDAYDAMTTNRPYRGARSPSAAMAEIRSESGRQFDPRVVVGLEAVLAPQLGSAPERRPARMPALSRALAR